MTLNLTAVCWFSSMLILTTLRASPRSDRGLLVLVDVDLDDLEGLAALGGDLLDHRRDAPARSAPRRPEVHEHRNVGLDDLSLKVVVGYVGDRSCHVHRLLGSRRAS